MTKKPVTIRIDETVWKEAKIRAIKENLTIGELVERALKRDLK